MLQLIVNKNDDRDTMIVSKTDKDNPGNNIKKVFIKTDKNSDTDEGKLYADILSLLDNYLN